MIEKVRLTEACARFHETWSPKIVGAVNDTHVKLVKLKGECVWHHHEQEDELFLVFSGHLIMKLRERDIHLDAGALVIIPRGVDHLPVAEQEVHVLLLEAKTTLNTGSVINERTVADPEWLS